MCVSVTHINKLWVFPPVNLSIVSLICRAQRLNKRVEEEFFPPLECPPLVPRAVPGGGRAGSQGRLAVSPQQDMGNGSFTYQNHNSCQGPATGPKKVP